MKKNSLFIFIFIFLMISSCNLVPSSYQIETTSELGQETLSRVDDLNAMLDRGVEIGPETRATIDALNTTISEGLKLGFTDSTLSRVDQLLTMIEDGVGIKVGLDPETNATVNGLIETLNDAPSQWEGTANQIIHTLEESTSNVAKTMANEIEDLMDQARIDTQQITATVGVEFRCNVDFLSTRAGDTVDAFIGRSIVGKLYSIVSGEEPELNPIPDPWVCQIIPDQIDLAQNGAQVIFELAVIKLSGYDYVDENLPTAKIVDEAGIAVPTVPLYPFLSSPYQIQLNLQGLDFSAIPPRSRILFDWPSSGASFALSIVFPDEEILPTETPTATITITSPSVDILKGPGIFYKVLGRAESGAIYEVLGQNGSGDWWQIDYDGSEAWVQNSAGVRNELSAPVVSIPLPPPTADFVMTPSAGEAPLTVEFTNSSSDGYQWAWDFGDGIVAYEPNPTHTFTGEGTYNVSLRVDSQLGYGIVNKTIEVEPAPIVLIPFQPIIVYPFFPNTPTPSFGSKTFLFRNFTQLPNNAHHDTGILTSGYDCGIVGLSATSGDIHESGADDILVTRLTQEFGTWWIHANFHTHNNHERWDIAVMCVSKLQSSTYNLYSGIRVNPSARETIDLEDLNIPENSYCGIAGMGAYNGDIREGGTAPYILKAYLEKSLSTGNWELTANFYTHNTEEVWDIDILCIYDNPNVLNHFSLTHLSNNGHRDTGVSSSEYACGVMGMYAYNGDIQENDAGTILQAYTYVGANGNWFVKTDFRTHGTHEEWNVNMLCVKNYSTTIVGNWGQGWAP
ncbi:MAG: PKD domain-containing protein [Chloroflexi bacterium]|nr:PKD domain-containing protein [Chloroflexota bacterium]MBT3669307.1 PKD domain-containing protein [Chloroflexota bacterium]MBT4306014.1 PKD domain-containing protein [Chloroflexota bacterium]MBT4532658.1 PKD domain-containing protein [Chloroflexota bacterium]MBT4684114.1 PKD domain-containing protein [Chloroflexota bacterium]